MQSLTPPSARFRIVATAEEATLHSIARLPFEPKDWRRDMRDQLAMAIRCMREVAHGERLVAEYTSEDRSTCDLENILLYNVGTAAFSPVAKNGFQLVRRFCSSSEPLDPVFRHFQRYRIAAREKRDCEWPISRELATFEFVPPKLRGLMKPEIVWLSCRSRLNSLHTASASQSAPLCVILTINLPNSEPVLPANVVKPLLDGIVASFHCHDGTGLDVVLPRLAMRLPQISPAELETLLTDESVAVLGKRNLVWPFREGIQWNPADDRVVEIDFRIEREPTSHFCRGTISECVAPN